MRPYYDGYYLNCDYLVTGETTKVRENGATTGIGVLATYAYNDLGSRVSTTFGNGVVQSFGYDPVARLTSLGLNFTGTTNDLTLTYAYNPASQIVSTTRSNDLYAWTGHGNGTTATLANGLNQVTSVGGVAATHDANGNMTTDPTTGTAYTYTSENLLKTGTGATPPTLTYDPAMRLWELAAGTGATRFAYDGLGALTQQDTTGTLFRRYVFGAGTDEALIQYEGTGATTRKFLAADERGSIIAMSDDAGNVTAINNYDEYGKPGAGNQGAFQYTGQTWFPQLGLYYYKARMYDAQLGRFMQPDPIGAAGGINLYAYVGDDPVNLVDPLGLVPVITGHCSNFGAALFIDEFGNKRCVTFEGGGIGQQPFFDPTLDERLGGAAGQPKPPLAAVQQFVVTPMREAASYCASTIDVRQIITSAGKSAAVGATRGAIQGYYLGFLFKLLPPGRAAATAQAAIGAVFGGITGAVTGAAQTISENCSGTNQ